MSKKNLWGAAIGFLTGGPVGAAIGYGVAKSFSDEDFQALTSQLNDLIAEGQRYQLQGQQMPPGLQQQFSSQLLRMQNQMQQLDHLHRQQYDTFVGGMLSNAAAAGFDTTGIRF